MPSFRHETRAEEVIEAFSDQIRGRTFVVTGTTEKGLGAYTAVSIARGNPANLILLSRTKSKVDSVIAEISAINPAVRTVFIPVDLADQDSVRKAAGQILADDAIPRVDVVINNAGLMNLKTFTTDAKGNEMQFSANHLGHFLLTCLLMPRILAAGRGARIVNLTSNGHQLSDVWWDDLTFGNGKNYDGWSAYGQSKTANLLFGVELTRRLKDRGITSFAVHPGTIVETGIGRHLESLADFDSTDEVARRNTGKGFVIDPRFKTTSQGTSTTLVAALDPELEPHSGAYILDCQVDTPYAYAVDPENAKRLWTISEELVGQKFDF